MHQERMVKSYLFLVHFMSRLLKDDPWLVKTIYNAKQRDSVQCGLFCLKVFLFTICCLRVQSCKLKNTEK